MSYKFLQGSDFFIGSNLSFIPNKVRDKVRRAQLKVFNEFVDNCEKDEYQGLLIPGNLFGSREAGEEYGKEVLETFRKLLFKSRSILLTTGRVDWHEPPDDFWTKSVVPLSFSFYKSTGYTSLVLQNTELTVGGFSFDSLAPNRWVIREKMEGVKEKIKTQLSVCLFNGNMVDSNSEKPTNQPFMVSELENSPFSYVGLGGFQSMTKVGNIGYYSGSPQAYNFDNGNLGDRFFLEIGIMDDGKFEARPIKVNSAVIFDRRTENVSSLDKEGVLDIISQTEVDGKVLFTELSGEVSEEVFGAVVEKEIEMETEGYIFSADNLQIKESELSPEKQNLVKKAKEDYEKASNSDEKKEIRGAIYWGLKSLS